MKLLALPHKTAAVTSLCLISAIGIASPAQAQSANPGEKLTAAEQATVNKFAASRATQCLKEKEEYRSKSEKTVVTRWMDNYIDRPDDCNCISKTITGTFTPLVFRSIKSSADIDKLLRPIEEQCFMQSYKAYMRETCPDLMKSSLNAAEFALVTARFPDFLETSCACLQKEVDKWTPEIMAQMGTNDDAAAAAKKRCGRDLWEERLHQTKKE